MNRHVYLIGYRGSGKSSVGRILARRLDRPFADTDAMVEAARGRTIREIFENGGEAAFRTAESAAIRDVALGSSPSVVALGGGAVLREENRLLLKSGVVFWLTASVETLGRRIAADRNTAASRPSLSGVASAVDEIREVLQRRTPIYEAAADHRLDTEGLSPEEIAARIIELLEGGRGTART